MSRFVAHGQNWEDVRLRRIFSDRRSGFYIDVGAGHPISHSFTHVLYRQGWRGVNVEPLPAFFTLLESERPADANLQAVLGRTAGASTSFFEVVDLRGSSTTRSDVADELRSQGLTVIQYDVPRLTLVDVCERFAPEIIDVLKVDVEGAEADVLHGGDWARFRPRLVVVEANEPETWEQLLLSHDYRHAAFDGINHWYVEAADVAWMDILGPPVSVLDHFIPYELIIETGQVESNDRAQARSREPSSSARPLAHVAGDRPRIVLVLSSSNQLYSGTGRVIFETLGRLTGKCEIELAIDDCHQRNTAIAREFSLRHGLPIHVGSGASPEAAPDTVNHDLASVLQGQDWNIVMGVSWANATTNHTLLEHLGGAALAYLPLHQPSWSIPLNEEACELVEATHRAMLLRADVVLCLTPWEQRALGDLVAPDLVKCAVVAPGCDFDSFLPGSPERGCDLLFVGDQREPRKRFDRVLLVLDGLRRLGIDARLVVAGNESERATSSLPPDLVDCVIPLGYVSEERIRRLYSEAAALLLLSDYEAFGLPMIEALACATPVVITDQPAPRSLFGDTEGVYFVDANNLEEMVRVTSDLLTDATALRARLIHRRAELARSYDWRHVAERTHTHLLAAWARRCRQDATFFPGPPNPSR